jgi:hypothetical protein
MIEIRIRGGCAIINREHLHILDSLYGLNVNDNGYVVGYKLIEKKPKWYRVHRLIMNPPRDMDIDHINGMRHDNRIENLRICTRQQNLRNMRAPDRNTSGFKGVSFFKRDGTWEAYLNYEGKKHRIGYFKNKIDAANAYNKAASIHYGEFARLNQIP